MSMFDFIDLDRGLIGGATMRRVDAYNLVLTSGTYEMLGGLSTAPYAAITTATVVRLIIAGNAADDAAGAGAITVLVEGIDENGVEISETILTNGIDVGVSSTDAFYRVYKMTVVTVGTYNKANTGILTLEIGAGSKDLLTMAAETGKAETSARVVPTGQVMYLLGYTVRAEDTADVDIRLMSLANIYDSSAPMSPRVVEMQHNLITGSFTYKPTLPMIFPADTEIWFEANGAGAAAAVSVQYEYILAAA